ncbi:DUF4097 family beta strand repeat-containing protein [Bhargavaea cecembensis]|uniref:DUF4097 family beta strand repeat-containing protein n=1 Tax=Bhargavaea cecembensis TaxID=394098 RepID=UPI000694C832|nr:DUF4097 family beta strand repeat-containing protein [Bhargavaea cecembensis]
MGKNEFLGELQRLLAALPEEEQADILTDLDEYFEEGAREGKDEREISSSLGSPEEIAKDILSAYPEYTETGSRPAEMDSRYEVIRLQDSRFNGVFAEIAAGELKLISSEDEVTRIELIGERSGLHFDASIKEDRLVIVLKGDRSLTSWFRRAVTRPFRTVVHLPKRMYDEIRIRSKNGTVSAEQTLARTFFSDSGNGRIRVRECAFRNLTARTDNGRIEISKAESETILCKTDNGRIELANVRAGRTTAETDNGRITLSDVEGDLSAETDNGRIELNTVHIDRNIHLKTDNGSITVQTKKLPEDAHIQVRSSTGKPDIFGNPGPEKAYGSGTHTVRLESDNGKIALRKI